MKHILLCLFLLLAVTNLRANLTPTESANLTQIEKIDSLIKIGNVQEADSLILHLSKYLVVNPDSFSNARLKLTIGRANTYKGNLNEAFQDYQMALYQFQEIEYDYWEAIALRYSANVKSKLGDFNFQKEYAGRSCKIFERLDSLYQYGTSLISLANAHRALGINTIAEELFVDAETIFTRIPRGASKLYSIRYNLADYYYQTGRLKEAKEKIKKAIVFYVSEEDDPRSAKSYNVLGAIEQAEQQYMSADSNFRKSLEYAYRSNDLQPIFSALINLSSVALNRSDVKDARTFYVQAQEIFQNSDKMILDKTYLDLTEQGIIALETELAKNWFLRAALILTILAALLIGFIYYIRQRNKRREQKFIHEREQKELEYKNDISEVTRRFHELTMVLQEENRDEKREQIAQKVHDIIGSGLYAVILKLDSVTPQNFAPVLMEETIFILENIREKARNIESQLEDLDTDWLVEIDRYFKTIANAITKPQVNFSTHGLEAGLPKHLPGLDLDIYRIVLNFMTNSLIYAEAKKIDSQISIPLEEGELNIFFEDDGKGFDPSIANRGTGLKSVYSIVKDKRGGKIEIDSEAGKEGTRITIVIPLHPKTNPKDE